MFAFLTRKPTASDAARALSKLGHDKHRDKVREVARAMREARGLAPSPALEGRA